MHRQTYFIFKRSNLSHDSTHVHLYHCYSAQYNHSQKYRQLTLFEPRREKTGIWGFRPGLTQTDLNIHKSMLEA